MTLPAASPGQQSTLLPLTAAVTGPPFRTVHSDFNSPMVFEFPPMPCLREAQLCSQATLDRPASYILRVPEAEQPLPVLSPGLFYVPPLPSIWALRNTIFRRELGVETVWSWRKTVGLELCQG